MNSVPRRRLRLSGGLFHHTLSLLMAISLVGITAISAQAAAGDGSGTMTVSPTSVSAASANTYAFTYTARAGGGGLTGQVTVNIATGFSAPQNTSSSNPGFVSIASGSCTSKSIAGVSSQTVTINMTCGSSQTFVLSYANATAPSAPNSYTFATASRNGAGGNFVQLAASPIVTVTAGPLAEIRISPQTATIASGGSQAYTAEGFDANGNSRGDVTGDTTFTIEPDGSCTGASCSATTAGDHTVTGTDGAFSDTATLTVAPEPTISSFTPTVGFVRKTVTIAGTGFTDATNVDFAGQSGTVTASFSVVSDAQISTRVPDGAVTGPISVTTPGGTASSSTSFRVRPKISGFTPTSGPVGTSVTINGSAFLGATIVKFNGKRATFTVVDYHTITATVPAGATTGPVVVVTPSGNAKSPRSFTVT
jgi:large repetitive protein